MLTKKFVEKQVSPSTRMRGDHLDPEFESFVEQVTDYFPKWKEAFIFFSYRGIFSFQSPDGPRGWYNKKTREWNCTGLNEDKRHTLASAWEQRELLYYDYSEYL